MKYAHIASRILSRPLLLEQGYAAVFFSAFGTRAGISSLISEGVELNRDAMRKTAESYQVSANRFGKGQYEPYAIMGDGVGVISVEGSLAHKTGSLEPESGMMGYDGIQEKMSMALSDPKVKTILLNIDSPGGEVSGAFDLADFIAQAKTQKKIVSYAGDTMASAAYLIGSQADAIYASQTASLGSIGVLVAHTDYSKAMENDGVKVTLIHSGEHKVDGSPYEPLADGVKAEIQSEIDSIRGKFAQYAANGRKKDKADMMATEARMYPAEAAVSVGLADGVMSFDQLISHLSQPVSRSGDAKPKGKQMTQEVVASAPGLSEAEVEKLMEAAGKEGIKAGASAERARIQAIVGHEAAEGRVSTANHLAFNTDMTPEAAVALLSTMPKAAVANQFAAGMTEGAGVKAEPEQTQVSEQDQALAATKAAIAALLKK